MTPASSNPNKGNAFGLVRLVLAGAVVYAHGFYLIGARPIDPLSLAGIDQVGIATLAVAAFFALSGMLVTPSFERTNSIFRFAWHRIVRIYPALLAALILTALALVPMTFLSNGSVPDFGTYIRHSLAYIWQNLLVPNSAPRIPGQLNANPVSDFTNASMWTLRYELTGYALVGIFGLLGLLGRWKAILWIGFGIGCLIATYDSLQPENMDRWFFRSEGKFMILIAVGGMVWATLPSSAKTILGSPSVVGLLAFGCFGLLHTELWSVGLAVTAAPILHFVGHRLPFTKWEKTVGGDYSYGIYILHYPVQQCLLSIGLSTLNPWLFLGISAAVALGLAVLSWRWIEKPSLALKHWSPFSAATSN